MIQRRVPVTTFAARPRLARSRGFSLLEVIVAFAIMAMSLGALYQLAGGSSRAAFQAESMTRMVLVAQSVLAEYPVVPAGGVAASGVSADGLLWQVESSEFPVTLDPQPNWRLHRLQVSVQTDAGARAQRVEFATLVPVVESP